MRKLVLSLIAVLFLSGCGGTAVHTLPPSGNTQGFVEKLIIQRGHDVFITENPQPHLGILIRAKDLYTFAYRREGEEVGVKTRQDIGAISESEKVEPTSEQDYTYVRVVQPSYLPEPGENAFPHKDIILFLDALHPDDAFVGIQNPEKPDEWRILQVREYGNWLKKEIDLHLSLHTGL